MKKIGVLLALLPVIISCGKGTDGGDRASSPTEGVIAADFVPESEMKDGLLQMLADFTQYMKSDFLYCDGTTADGEEYGCFRGEQTMASGERGVRPNADMSMVCAFLCRYARGKVRLPDSVDWGDIEDMAMRSLVYACSTHKANALLTCSDGRYWGSTGADDYVWESSLWAMSVAYSAYFQWDRLSERLRGRVGALLRAECRYELEREIPTGYAGDSKSEENGWEACVLAAALGLFPDDAEAPLWFARLREFAVNSYSHVSDACDDTVIDPWYDGATVAQLYRGKNLYDDYTLQNHDLFHTSYQNVVMQELGEAALALKLFQTGQGREEKWKTAALMHNNREVFDNVLKWLALADGELAMPNGNDWSLFLFDQITSYTTMACFLADGDALMLENLAYKYIRARQSTTEDGSWLLRPDVGARRMGVQAHRVMMSWLMHELMPVGDLRPSRWDEFAGRYGEAKLFDSQNVVRAFSGERFSCFSWSRGLRSYTGYFVPNSVDRNKIIVPYRDGNTGNYLGAYTVEGRRTDAVPVVPGIYSLDGCSYTMNGELLTNGSALDHRFAIYSTPGNAIVYLDCVRAVGDAVVTAERGGLMAVSTDPFTKEERNLYYGSARSDSMDCVRSDGTHLLRLCSDWINIDNAVGIVAPGNAAMAFGDRAAHNSILTSKLYPHYSDGRREYGAGEPVGMRSVVYYSNISAERTREMRDRTLPLAERLPSGWNGIIAPEPDGSCNLLLSNFASDSVGVCRLENIGCPLGAPVFPVSTEIRGGKSSAEFRALPNRSIACHLQIFITGDGIRAMLQDGDGSSAVIENPGGRARRVEVAVAYAGTVLRRRFTLGPASSARVSLDREGMNIGYFIQRPSQSKNVLCQ